jgi:hypothetical protein
MTLSSANNKSGPYAGNGVTTAFAGTFRISDPAHVQVIETDAAGVETVRVLTADYAVSDMDGAGFSVTMLVPPSAGSRITLIRNVPFTQEVDLQNQGAYFAEVIEQALDAAVSRDQQLQEQVSRSVKIPASADLAGLDTLIGSILVLGENTEELTELAAITEEVETLAAIGPQISTVAVIAGPVATVSGIAGAVTTVAAANTGLTAISTNLSVLLAVPGAAAASASAASSSATAAAGSASAAATSASAAAASASSVTPLPVQVNAASAITTIADADLVGITETTGPALKKITWASVKTALMADKATAIAGTDNTKSMSPLRVREVLDGSPLSGLRNRVVNGDFDIWQRGTTVAGSPDGFTADRWKLIFNGSGATRSVTRQVHALGQTDVPGNPSYYLRYNQSVAGTGGSYNVLSQPIEGVRSFAGRTVTVTFYARFAVAASLPSIYFTQRFGTGGSPSASVDTAVQVSPSAIGTAWQKMQYVVAVPSIAGKTLGTADNDHLRFDIYLPNNAALTLDISHVSIVEGDATGETDPFSPRHVQQEDVLCKRYFEAVPVINVLTGCYASTFAICATRAWSAVKRAVPTCSVSGVLATVLTGVSLHTVYRSTDSYALVFSTSSAVGTLGTIAYAITADSEF